MTRPDKDRQPFVKREQLPNASPCRTNYNELIVGFHRRYENFYFRIGHGATAQTASLDREQVEDLIGLLQAKLDSGRRWRRQWEWERKWPR